MKKNDKLVTNEQQFYLEDQTALLVQTIQSLVSAIRSESGLSAVTAELTSISTIITTIVASVESTAFSSPTPTLRTSTSGIIEKLNACKLKVLEAGRKGVSIAEMEDSDGRGEMEWRVWTQSLPPIAFEIARETKELVQRVDAIDGGHGGEGGERDFS